MSLYFDEKNNIKPCWVTEEAEKAAQSFYVLGRNGRVDDRKSLKNSQLRKFYGEFKELEAEITQAGDAADERFLSVLPRIKMAAAKVTYAKARGVVPNAFVIWLKKHTTAVNSAEDFRAFLLHFEAVVGYCYGINAKD